MKLIHAWPLTSYFSAYVDQKKSQPHLEKGKLENPKGLPYWTPEKRYLANLEDYLSVIKKLDLELNEVFDPNTKKILIRFYVVKGKSAIYNGKEGNGMIDLQYSPELWAYRKRADGLLGIESFGVDTRLSVEEKIKNPDKYPLKVVATSKEEANFSSLTEKEVK